MGDVGGVSRGWVCRGREPLKETKFVYRGRETFPRGVLG